MYRANAVEQAIIHHPTFWSRLLDRIFGEYCNCPSCMTDCNRGKRPKFFSKHHLLSDMFPWCLFGKHKDQGIEIDGAMHCSRCGVIIGMVER